MSSNQNPYSPPAPLKGQAPETSGKLNDWLSAAFSALARFQIEGFGAKKQKSLKESNKDEPIRKKVFPFSLKAMSASTSQANHNLSISECAKIIRELPYKEFRILNGMLAKARSNADSIPAININNPGENTAGWLGAINSYDQTVATNGVYASIIISLGNLFAASGAQSKASLLSLHKSFLSEAALVMRLSRKYGQNILNADSETAFLKKGTRAVLLIDPAYDFLRNANGLFVFDLDSSIDGTWRIQQRSPEKTMPELQLKEEQRFVIGRELNCKNKSDSHPLAASLENSAIMPDYQTNNDTSYGYQETFASRAGIRLKVDATGKLYLFENSNILNLAVVTPDRLYEFSPGVINFDGTVGHSQVQDMYLAHFWKVKS